MWTKARNVFSEDASDPLVEKNLHKANVLGATAGTAIAVSSKELNASEFLLQDRLRTLVTQLGVSGWLTRGAYSFSGGFSSHTFRMAQSDAVLNGYALFVVGTSLDSVTLNEFTLSAPPGSGTRDDLVYVELFLVEVPGSTVSVPTNVNKPSNSTLFKWGNVDHGGSNIPDDINEVNFEIRRRVQIQYRIRFVDDVDFTSFPAGMDDPGVLAQGGIGNGSPTAVAFAQDTNDLGLFVAGTGSLADQTTLKTLDGYVRAIPLARVLRTNGQNSIVASDVTDLRTVWGGARGRTSTLVTGDYQAQDGDRLLVDVSGGALSITLPPVSNLGDWFTVQHVGGDVEANIITMDRNGHKIMALDEDLEIRLNNLSVDFTYYNVPQGWRIG